MMYGFLVATRVALEARDEIKWLQRVTLMNLKVKVDLTVALIHAGCHPGPPVQHGNTDATRALDKDKAIQTASRKRADILITGHAHVGTPEPIKVGNTLILQRTAAALMSVNCWIAARNHTTFYGGRTELKTILLYVSEARPQTKTG